VSDLSVVIAEDPILLREGLARLLRDAGIDVAGQAGNADELLLKVRSYSPSVAVVDIRMPPTHATRACRRPARFAPRIPGRLCSSSRNTWGGLCAGASLRQRGYLLKDRVSDVGEFIDALRRVAGGGSALDPTVVSQLVGRRRDNDPIDDLTLRERDVVELMAEGRSNQGIAERLVVSERAVEKHVTSIFSKPGLPPASADHRRVLAVLKFLGRG
jgi:DNA-binding NarL/FixJ family response regulator